MKFFLKQLCENFTTFSENIAFYIEEESYTYADLGYRVSAIQQQISKYNQQQYFGVVTRNSIDTFATIFALWLTGKTSVPISGKNPHNRNQYVLDQVEIKTIFDSNTDPLKFESITSCISSAIPSNNYLPNYVEVATDTDLYLLFTSGSTGLPKGVRISQRNLDAYLNAFFNCGYQITPSDRCIEVFELTFDASVQCYTFPLMKGASVYTLPDDGIRFLSILKIMTTHDITFVKMTPSAIYYLQPYFNQIYLPHLKYCLFGAEAFPVDLVKRWETCVPNAEIHNVYGPTEATINCTSYKWKKNDLNKSRNGIATIGKPYSKIEAIICDEKQNELPAGTKGELCVSGAQVTKGYWRNQVSNELAFFNKVFEKEEVRFYRTGDLAIKDEEGDLLYVGRIDSQVQIDGHRIELGEIEHHAGIFTKSKCVALVAGNEGLINQIVLFVEGDNADELKLIAHLRKTLPGYMIPHKVVFLKQIPLLSSGKTDRQKLQTKI